LIDLRAARADPEGFRGALARKGAAEAFDELMQADARWRELETQASELRAETKTSGKPSPEELERLKGLKGTLQQVEAELEQAAERRQELLARVSSSRQRASASISPSKVSAAPLRARAPRRPSGSARAALRLINLSSGRRPDPRSASE